MKRYLVGICGIFLSVVAYAASIEGTYDCNECNGLLEVKKQASDSYSVKLLVGQGSCGGEVVVKGRSRLLNGNELRILYKNNKKSCTTKIKLHNEGVLVSDSCYTVEDEAGSTCTTLGEYSKR